MENSHYWLFAWVCLPRVVLHISHQLKCNCCCKCKLNTIKVNSWFIVVFSSLMATGYWYWCIIFHPCLKKGKYVPCEKPIHWKLVNLFWVCAVIHFVNRASIFVIDSIVWNPEDNFFSSPTPSSREQEAELIWGWVNWRYLQIIMLMMIIIIIIYLNAIYSFLRCEWAAKHQHEDVGIPEFSNRSLPLYYPKVSWKIAWECQQTVMHTQCCTDFRSNLWNKGYWHKAKWPNFPMVYTAFLEVQWPHG